MTAEHTGTERARSKTIERWSAYLEELHERIAHRFLRPAVRTRVYRYLAGLLGEVERKNSWQKAAIGEVRPRGVQHLLNDSRWDPDAVRDDLREYVLEHLGDENGVERPANRGDLGRSILGTTGDNCPRTGDKRVNTARVKPLLSILQAVRAMRVVLCDILPARRTPLPSPQFSRIDQESS